MAGEHGKNMSMEQFQDVVQFIRNNHAWGQGHWIKYIRPSYDTRCNEFFGITFEGMRGEKKFFVINEDRNRDLTEWVMEFLTSDPEIAWEIDWSSR